MPHYMVAAKHVNVSFSLLFETTLVSLHQFRRLPTVAPAVITVISAVHSLHCGRVPSSSWVSHPQLINSSELSRLLRLALISQFPQSQRFWMPCLQSEQLMRLHFLIASGKPRARWCGECRRSPKGDDGAEGRITFRTPMDAYIGAASPEL